MICCLLGHKEGSIRQVTMGMYDIWMTVDAVCKRCGAIYSQNRNLSEATQMLLKQERRRLEVSALKKPKR